MKSKCVFAFILSLFFAFTVFSFLYPQTAFSESSKMKKVIFKCDWHHGVQFLGFYIAKENRYYEKEGLDVFIEELENIQELNSLPKMVSNGKYDISIGSYTLTLGQSKGLPIVALASIYQRGPQVFFATKEKNLTHPRDFKGMRISDKGDSWRKLLEEFLATANLSLSDVVLIKSGYDMTPFYDDTVDIWGGYITNEVQMARLKGIKIDTFPAYEYGLHYLGNNIYSSRQYIKENPDTITAFLAATIRGWEYAINNPAESVKIMIRRFPQLAKKKEFLLLSFDSSIPLVIPPGKKIGNLECESWMKNPIFKNFQPNRPLCDKKYLENAWKRLEKG
jgi:NitT/TauT family transport system substrate-binding protein